MDKAKRSGALQKAGYGYIDVLNAHLAEKLYPVQIKKDCNRIEGRLRRVCGEVVNKFVGKNGSSYRKLMVEQREIKIGIRADEIISIAELERELENEKNRNHQLALDNEILQNRCELYDHMLEFETQKREADSLRVKNTNEIDKLVTKNR